MHTQYCIIDPYGQGEWCFDDKNQRYFSCRKNVNERRKEEEEEEGKREQVKKCGNFGGGDMGWLNFLGGRRRALGFDTLHRRGQKKGTRSENTFVDD